MKDSDYIIIDTPELKALFAPKQATDEYLSSDNIWLPVYDDKLFGRESIHMGNKLSYRRLRSRAWLAIETSVGASHPCHWNALWLLHKDGTRRWAAKWSDGMIDNFTHWQPADAAPDPPSLDEEAFEKALKETKQLDSYGTWKDAFRKGFFAALGYTRGKVKERKE